jgi:thioredoxin 1
MQNDRPDPREAGAGTGRQTDRVNTDEHPQWMQKFGIQGIPTLLFISGGKVVHRQVGALPERMLRDVVNQFMEVISNN